MQQQTQQHPVVRQRLEVLLRGITLAPDQQSKVDSVVARHNAEIQRLAGAGHMMHRDSTGRDDNGNGNGDSNPELKSALEKQEKEIRDVLTDEQKQTWDRNAEQLKQQHKRYDDNFRQQKDSR
jgi:hypothetical protein